MSRYTTMPVRQSGINDHERRKQKAMSNNDPNNTLALYGEFTPEANEEDIEESKSLYTSRMLGKLANGKTVLRMFPPRVDQKKPWIRVWEHYVDISSERTVQFVCPRVTAKLRCRVCDKAKMMMASSNPLDRERGEDLLPQAQMYANVINRAAPHDGVKIMRFSGGILKTLQTIRDPAQGAGVNFTHPITGYDLIINRTGTTKKDTRYAVMLDGKQSMLGDDLAATNELLRQMHDLNELNSLLSDEDIQRKLAGEKVTRPTQGAPQLPAHPTFDSPSTPKPAIDRRPTAASMVYDNIGAAASASDAVVPQDGDDDL